MNRILSSTTAALIFSCLPSVGNALPLNDDFTLLGNVGVYSDYRSRGLSQNLGDPALQLSGTLLHNKTGLYAGAWTSNVNFGYGLKTRQEVDYYAGWYIPFSDNISLDTGYTVYTYPKESQFNQSEWYANLSAYGVKASLFYSTDAPIVGGEDSTLYATLGYETMLPKGIGFEARYGFSDYRKPVWIDKDGHARESYREWEVKLSHQFLGADWSVSYVDTDLSDAECMNYSGFDDLCSATVVVGISKDF